MDINNRKILILNDLYDKIYYLYSSVGVSRAISVLLSSNTLSNKELTKINESLYKIGFLVKGIN